MKLYQNPMSPPCRRVLATMYHLNSPVELMTVDFKTDQLSKPEYTKMNPNGAVPLLVDGDFNLWESTAIMQYLAEKKGDTKFYPADAKSRADIARWNAWSMCHFSPAAGTIVWESYMKPMFGMGEADQAAVKTATENFHKYAKVLEQHLANRAYALGDAITLADFTLGSTLMYADAAKLPWGAYKNIQAWYKRLEATDAWKKSTPKM